MKGKIRTFTIGGIIVLFLVAGAINFTQSFISLDKKTYYEDESVLITISEINVSDVNLMINTNDVSYKYVGVNPDVTFIPRYLSTYEVVLTNISTGEIIETKNFTVVPQEPGQISSQGNIAISTNKEKYVLGDLVLIYIQPQLEQGQEIIIRHGNSVNKYYGLPISPLQFYPKIEGEYIIEIHDKDNNLLANSSFFVGNVSVEEKINEIRQEFNISEENIKSIKINGIDGKLITIGKENNLTDSELFLENSPIDRITFRKLKAENISELKIEKLALKRISSIKEPVLKSFLIDASKLEFENATVESIAVGQELYKCKNWSEISGQCNGNWEKLMNLIPGKPYSFTITANDPAYIETGVASINTEKSRYHPNEEAKIFVVVLDKAGYLTSDATVVLDITSPNGDTTIYSSEDSSLTKIQKGIYRAIYSSTDLEGNYSMDVTATGPNVNNTFSSFFSVESFYPFDILRSTPLATDPWAGPFNSSIKLVSFIEAGTFDFSEVLPINFTIAYSGGAIVREEGDKKILTWTNLQNNSVISYAALPPLITPELYEIGPAYVDYNSNTFTEARAWYIAIDPQIAFNYTSGSDPNSGWTNPSRAWDQINNNYATRTIAKNTDPDSTNYLTVNVSNASDMGGRITSVEIGIEGYGQSGDIAAYLIPYFGGTVAGGRTYTIAAATYGSSDDDTTKYVNITNDPNAPATWTWSDVINLDVRAYGGNTNNGQARTMYIDQIRVRVTYAPAPTITQIYPPASYSNSISDPYSMLFNCSITAEGGAKNISLYITNSTNASFAVVSNCSLTTDGPCTWTRSLANGNYTWNCLGYDVFNQSGWGTNRSILINYAPSAVTITQNYPPAGYWNSTSDPYSMYFNCSINATAGAKNISLYVTNSTNASFALSDNCSIAANGSCTWAKSLSNGNYTWNCLGYDTSNDAGWGTNRSILINFTAPPADQPNVTILEPANRTSAYNYSGITNPSSSHQAFGGGNAAKPPAAADSPIEGTELSTANYGNIAQNDSNRAQTTVSTGGLNAYQSFKFSITDSVFDINSLRFTHIGYALKKTSLGADTFSIYVYNFTSDSYITLVDVAASTSDALNQININTGFSDLISNGKIYFLVEGDFTVGTGSNARADMLTNFVELVVQSRPALSGTAVRINVTAADPHGIASCSYAYYNSSARVTNLTGMLNATSQNYFNTSDTTIVNDNSYNLTVICIDTYGYRNNASIQVRIDNTLPTITLISPLNYMNFTQTYVTATWNATDTLNTYLLCNATLNRTVQHTNVLTTSYLQISKNFTSLSDGSYFWNVTCIDAAGNKNSSQTYQFDVDTTAPSIALNYPALNGLLNTRNVVFNYTPSDAHSIINCSLILNNGINQTNQSIVRGTPNTFSINNMAEGYYTWSVNCTDSFNFTGSSSTRNFTIDATPPAVYLNTSSGTIFTNGVANLNYTVYDNYNRNLTCNVTVNSVVQNSNIRTTNGTLMERNISLQDGFKLWNVTCWDDAGNINTSETRNFSVVGGPYVELLKPQNGNITDGVFVNFTYYASDGDGIYNCSFVFDGVWNQSKPGQQITNPGNNSFNLTNIPEGTHNWTVLCYDTGFSPGTASPYLIYVDKTKPNIQLNSPRVGEVYNNSLMYFNFTAFDELAKNLTCNLTVDGNIDPSNSNVFVYNGTSKTLSQTLANGNHDWNVTCKDIAGNVNTSLTRSFTTNSTFPVTVTVTTDKVTYQSGEIANITVYTKNESSLPLNSNLTMDIIYTNTTNTTAPWWNTTWPRRKPISISNSGAAIENQYIRVNITNLEGYISDCTEIRIVEDSSLSVISSSIVGGDNSTFCTVIFNASVSANAVNEVKYHAYYNYSDAPANGFNYASTLKVYNYTTYNLDGHHAYASTNVVSKPPTTLGMPNEAEFTAANYGQINSSDDSRVTSTSPDYRGHRFQFNITQDRTKITRLVILWEGYASEAGSAPIDLFVWSHNSQTWGGSEGSTTATGGDALISVAFTSEFTRIINSSGNMNIMIESESSNGNPSIYSDTIYINLTYDTFVDVNSSAGYKQVWIARNTSATGTSGQFSRLFNTSGQNSGNYTVVGSANSAGYREGRKANWFTIIGDTFGPAVTLITPANRSVNRSTSMTFTYTANDVATIVQNCSLIINGIVNQTNSTIVENQYNNFTISNLGENIYLWTVNCSDDQGNIGTAGEYVLTIDNTPPTVTPYYPNGTVFNTNSVTFNWTAVDNYDSSMLCNVSVDNGAYYQTKNVNNNTVGQLTINNILNGIHYWNVSCYDDIYNRGNSITLNFTITASPSVKLHAPADGYGFSNVNITLFYNVSDSSLSNCSLILNNRVNETKQAADIPYQSSNGINNFTLTDLSAGSYNWTVNCTSTYGFTGTDTQREFQIDFNAPTINLTYPPNNATVYSSSINFNFTAFDTVDPLLTCNLTINGQVNKTNISATNGVPKIQQVTGFTAGNYTWNVTCWDNAGLVNISETRNFSLNSEVLVTLLSPDVNAIDGDGNVVFTYLPQSIADFNLLGYCELVLDGRSNKTDIFIENDQINNFTTTSPMTDGYHTWLVNCSDNNLNSGWGGPRDIYIDLFNPSVTAHYPSDITLNASTTLFNWTATDNLDTNLSCNLTLDGAVRASRIASLNGSVINYTLTNLNDSIHYWNVTCVDDGGRKNTSQTLNFTVAEPPRIRLDSPANNNRTSAVNVTFFFTPTDNSNSIFNCSLILNGRVNATNTNINPGVQNNITGRGLDNGEYNWTINCTDFFGTVGTNDSTRRLIIDRMGPYYFDLTAPYEGESFNQENILFNYTVNDSYSTAIYCNLSLDAVVNASNIPGTSGQWKNATINNLTQGNHNWSVTCWDDLGNVNSSGTVKFIVNAPDLTVNETSIYFNNSNPDAFKNITIFANISNIGGVAATNVLIEFFDGLPDIGTLIGNTTINVASNNRTTANVSWNITEGLHTVYVIIDRYSQIVELNDSNNNASRNISTLISRINLPGNGTWYDYSNLTINFTVADFLGGAVGYSIFIDGRYNGQNGTANDNVSKLLNVTLNEGVRYIVVQANDTSGRRKNSSGIYLNIDLTAPLPRFETRNASWFADSTPEIRFNITDNTTSILNYTLFVNDAIETTGNATNGTTIFYNLTSKINGSYILKLEAVDYVGHRINSTPLTIYIDTENPIPNIETPDNSAFGDSTPQMRFNITDNLALNLTFAFFVDGVFNTNGTVPNGTTSYANLSMISDGYHAIILQGRDLAGNVQNSSSITILIDTIGPQINLSEPANNSNFTVFTIQFNYTAVDVYSTNMTCNLTIDNIVRNTSTVQNNTLTSIDVTLSSTGVHYWNVTCQDLLNNTNKSATWQFEILKPDFYIISDYILFNDTLPAERSNITINATIRNIGQSDGTNITVRVYDGNPALNNQINGNFSVNITQGSNVTISVIWTALIGPHYIWVVVDPLNRISEGNETNNNASKLIEISNYDVRYGNLTGIFVVQNNLNGTVYSWNVETTNYSNVFVVDYDVSPSFTTLQAIGKNITNESSPNDFVKIDVALGSTNFSDSINKTYTYGGSPVGYSNFTIYKRVILDVPVVNSTNTSNFITGIMWDTKNSTEYNGTQPLYFATRVNLGMEGRCGICDYEIKIPATLRINKGPDTQRVTVYAELK
jgi:hypothetical protein